MSRPGLTEHPPPPPPSPPPSLPLARACRRRHSGGGPDKSQEEAEGDPDVLGLGLGEVQLAWDFVTASEQGHLGILRTMRAASNSWLDSAVPAFSSAEAEGGDGGGVEGGREGAGQHRRGRRRKLGRQGSRESELNMGSGRSRRRDDEAATAARDGVKVRSKAGTSAGYVDRIAKSSREFGAGGEAGDEETRDDGRENNRQPGRRQQQRRRRRRRRRSRLSDRTHQEGNNESGRSNNQFLGATHSVNRAERLSEERRTTEKRAEYLGVRRATTAETVNPTPSLPYRVIRVEEVKNDDEQAEEEGDDNDGDGNKDDRGAGRDPIARTVWARLSVPAFVSQSSRGHGFVPGSNAWGEDGMPSANGDVDGAGPKSGSHRRAGVSGQQTPPEKPSQTQSQKKKRVETLEAGFVVRVPRCVASGERAPSAIVQYGHGLFGDRAEVLEPFLGELAERGGWVLVAADWRGMSRIDLSTVARALIFEPELLLSGLPENLMQVGVDACFKVRRGGTSVVVAEV